MLFTPLRGRDSLRPQASVRRYIAFAALCDLFLLCVQLFLCFTYTAYPVSDARSYMELAQYCAQENVWYPGERDMFAYYIFGNGYVNLLSVLFRITPNLLWAYLLNVAFTQVIVVCTGDLCYQLTGRVQTACLASALLCLMGGLWGEAVSLRTELCFLALAMLSLCLLTRRRGWALFLSGMVLGLANWVRPLLVIFLPASLLYLLIHRAGVRRIAAYLCGAALVIGLIGAGTQAYIGKFVFQAQTMGVNMLMGANDDADGSFLGGHFYEPGGAGYIDPEEYGGVTFDQRDAIYKERAVTWIFNNIPAFVKLIPAKLFYFLATDTYGGSAFFNGEVQTDNLAYLLSLRDILLGRGARALHVGDVVAIVSQVMYTLVLALYILNIVDAFRRGYILTTLPLHAIFALSCGVTVLTLGGARYHMPYLPIFCVCAAIQLECRDRRAQISY